MVSPDETPAVSSPQLLSTLALCVATAALSAFTFGFHLGEVNQPRDAMSNCDPTDALLGLAANCIPMNDWEWGTFVSIFLLGGTLGGLSGGTLVANLGRRRLLFLNNIPFLLSSFLLATSASVTGLYAGRFVGGVAAGLGTVAVPLYIAEVAPVKIRGSLGALNQLSIVIGVLVSQTLGVPLSTRESWRYLFAAGAVVPLIQCILLPFCVESPRWLTTHGLMADARKALIRLRSDSGASASQIEDELVSMGGQTVSPQPGEDVESGLMDASESAPLTNNNSATTHQRQLSVLELFSVSALRRPLIACVGLQLAQQFSGINAAVFYSTTIFNKSYSPDVAIKLSLLVSVVQLVTTLAASSLIEKLGRKSLLLTSQSGMMCSAFVIFVANKLDLSSALVVVALMSFVGFFGIGLGAIPWLILPELIPGYAVNSASSFCSGVNWGSSWFVAFLLPVVIGYLEYDVFFLFGLFLLGFTLFTNSYVPETKGMSAEEVARVNHFI
ncbi:hypothetical protein HDU98_011800 [Podochytrium sp. JEL0797]|nr:hypothetical protein HDU98_011800 [Podochytrium sp. JEL0797]